jgi:PKD domain
MKKIQLILSLFVIALLVSCTPNKEELNIDAINAPSAISTIMYIKPDNSGKVKITPSGDGVTQFQVYYGDSTTTPAILNPGESIEHIYPEGTFSVKIIGTTLNGKTTEAIIPLTVTFFAPSNLVVTITPIPSNNLGITVKATADFESGFRVLFGEITGETPTTFLQGEELTHIYSNPGTYQVRVVAFAGSFETAPFTQNVTVVIPIIIQMPLDFESATLPYTFTSFGGANTVVGANTHSTGINTSSKVGILTKGNGSQVWAGSFIELSNPLNFSVMKKIKMKVWSPQAGIVVKMKLENLANANTNIERDVTATVTNGWQELTFDFTGISLTNTYQRVVVFFDFGVSGNGAIYNFDDIKQSN